MLQRGCARKLGRGESSGGEVEELNWGFKLRFTRIILVQIDRARSVFRFSVCLRLRLFLAWLTCASGIGV